MGTQVRLRTWLLSLVEGRVYWLKQGADGLPTVVGVKARKFQDAVLILEETSSVVVSIGFLHFWISQKK